MTSDPRLTIELNNLCGKLREAEITDTEAMLLDEILRTSRSARRFYRAFMALASAMETRTTLQGSDDLETGEENHLVLLSQLLEIEQQAEQVAAPARTQPVEAAANDRSREDRLGWREIAGVSGYLLGRALVSRPAKYAYAYAALFLLAATLIFVLIASDGPASTQNVAGTNQTDPPADLPTAVATLTATHNAAWTGPASAAPIQGDMLRPNQRLTLTAGFAEITTARGAVAILEAPATIELTDNNNALRLHTGKLVGICETESSKGFLVRTPHMDVTDLGTRFGVDATDPDVVQAYVFEGEIEVATTIGNTGETDRKRVFAGQAMAASALSSIKPTDFEPSRFVIQPMIEELRPDFNGKRVFWVGQADGDFQLGQRESDDVQVFLERAGHTLDEDTIVDFTGDVQWRKAAQPGGAIVPAGQAVDVYLIHYDRLGVTRALDTHRSIVIHFDRPILGVIADESTLHATDASLGTPGVQYPDLRGLANGRQRGLDININDTAQRFNDGRSIRLNLDTEVYLDQVRILVESKQILEPISIGTDRVDPSSFYPLD
jgi:ferric-dicitrate binding protein FerR (iron transport regulator)